MALYGKVWHGLVSPCMATFRHGHFPRKELDGDRKTARTQPNPYLADDIHPLEGIRNALNVRITACCNLFCEKEDEENLTCALSTANGTDGRISVNCTLLLMLLLFYLILCLIKYLCYCILLLLLLVLLWFLLEDRSVMFARWVKACGDNLCRGAFVPTRIPQLCPGSYSATRIHKGHSSTQLISSGFAQKQEAASKRDLLWFSNNPLDDLCIVTI